MREDIKDTLRKVLALTDSPVEGEAQAASAHLARLLEKYNLEIADLESKGQSRPGIAEKGHSLGKAAFNWKLSLAEHIASFYYCEPLIGWREKTVAFIGRPDNVEALTMLYQWLIDQIRAIASQERYAHIEQTGEHIDPLRWQCGFGEGAAKRLGERLQERRERESSEAGTALVLSHAAEVSDYLEEKYGYRRDGRRTKIQREWDERVATEREARQRLKETDLEAYYEKYPWERPEEKERRAAQYAAEVEKEKKRQERNARRREAYRRKHGYRGRGTSHTTHEEWRKLSEKAAARRSGRKAAENINIEPFIEGGEEPKQLG